jgi:hypothetical protein
LALEPETIHLTTSLHQRPGHSTTPC